MRREANTRAPLSTLCVSVLSFGAAALVGATCPITNTNEPVGSQTFASPQSNPIVLSADGTRLYVVATTSNTLEVFDTATNAWLGRAHVGLEPVSAAVRPGTLEVWVSNHVSDSVSVVDVDPASDTYLQVIATVQDLDASGVSRFDEPAGIAFASSGKAYVALSSRNQIAIVDAATRQVTGSLAITAQDPRAIAVRNGLLYVTAFESGNQSELSSCPAGGSPPQCTLDFTAILAFVNDPNMPGLVKNIVIDPDVPDRDLFVFDTSTDALEAVVSGVGTLLYGISVDGAGRAFITQTEARNAVNGLEGMNLPDLENRIFLNQIATVSCSLGSGCGGPSVIELEPLPPSQPAAGEELATPYGVALSDDDTTAVATAAGTSRLFTLDTASGTILDRLDLDAGVPADFGQQIPKGVALLSDGGGAPQTAYVLNTLENTISVVDVSNPSAVVHVTKMSVGMDPTPDAVRKGRIALNNAFASNTGTFSCGSCHPDGNTDQLLWRIGGACVYAECSGDDEIRSTMPIRGLRNTLPLHWDGVPGDPFGGPNGSVGSGGSAPPNCDINDPQSCFRNLVDGAQGGVMCDQVPSCAAGPSGLPGLLTTQEREDMASFLAEVSYPPARSRLPDDSLTASAVQGFKDFFTDQGGSGPDPDTCADTTAGCHPLPLGATTNSASLNGFDSPTMRGMTDRFLQFSIGITSSEETLAFAAGGYGGFFPPPVFLWDPAQGFDELVTLAAAFPVVFDPLLGLTGPADIFQMFEEASTGFPATQGRQVTLDATTTSGGSLAATEAIMNDLELADQRGLVNLRAIGVWDPGNGIFARVVLTYREATGTYTSGNNTISLTHGEMISGAQGGTLIVTLTGSLRKNFGSASYRQPVLSPLTLGGGPTGDPALPVLPGDNPMALTGVDVRGDGQLLVDGVPVAGAIACLNGGSFTPYCDSEVVQITLTATPSPDGLHVLQVQNDAGPLSNELPICVGPAAGCQ